MTAKNHTLELDEFTLQDSHQLINWIPTERELLQFAGPIFNIPLTRDQIETYLQDKKRKVFKVMYGPTASQYIGVAELYDVSVTTAKIARVLIGEKSIRGKGIGVKLIRQLISHSFNKDNKTRVSLKVYDWNIPAIRCYEKVGFVQSNTKPEITKFGEELWSSIEMQMERN